MRVITAHLTQVCNDKRGEWSARRQTTAYPERQAPSTLVADNHFCRPVNVACTCCMARNGNAGLICLATKQPSVSSVSIRLEANHGAQQPIATR